MARCDAELCPNWTGQGCICDVLDLPRIPRHIRDCEWASGIGEGLHIDHGGEHEAERPRRFIATCCDVGEIDGPEGLPTVSGSQHHDR